MNVAAVVFALLAIVAGLLALFGTAVGTLDSGTLCLVFMACTLLFMNLPAVWRTRTA